MNYDNDRENTTQSEIDNSVTQGAKDTARNVINKSTKKIAKALKRALFSLIKLLLPFIGFIILFIGIIFLVYSIDYEYVGTEKQYTGRYENPFIYSEDNKMLTTENEINTQNKTIRDFYIYFSGQSLWQLRKDKGEMVIERFDDYNTKMNKENKEDKKIEDYYKREELFRLAPNFLYSLDRELYKSNFKYPEQFVKPVYYDIEEFKTLNLTNEEGKVIAQSEEEDLKTGEKTGKKIDSIMDYGLGTILLYNYKEDYQRNVFMEGKYYAEERYDPKTDSIYYVDVDIPYKIDLEGYPEPINIIDKAMTFTGTTEYNYEYKDQELSDLIQGNTSNEVKPYTKVLYDTYVHTQRSKTPGKGFSWDEEEQVYIKETVVDLYRYREGKIYENVPVVVGTERDDLADKYYKDYIYNFESYIPEGTINDFDFKDRIDYDSDIFNVDKLINEDYAFDIGTHKNTRAYESSMNYFNIVSEVAGEFGVDPYVIIAMIAQESGGNPYINNGGLMQIGSMHNEITATDKYGTVKTVKVEHGKINDPRLNITYGVMYFKNLLDIYDNDPYKALQAYNFGPGTLNRIKEINKEAWDSPFGWLIYRERAREMQKPGSKSASIGCLKYPNQIVNGTSTYGDSCYIENVLRYYTGNDVKGHKGGFAWNSLKSLGSLFWDFITQRDEEELVPKQLFVGNLNEDTPEDIIRLYRGLDESQYFSDVEYGDLDFFNVGFFENNLGISYGEILSMAPNSNGYVPPLDGEIRISSGFGYRIHPISKVRKLHSGIDLPAPIGTKVYATAGGKVISSDYGSGLGFYVAIDHGNRVISRYLHLSTLGARVGDVVKQGQVIGLVGSTGNSTGPHLHFELKVDGQYIDPTSIVLDK